MFIICDSQDLICYSRTIRRHSCPMHNRVRKKLIFLMTALFFTPVILCRVKNYRGSLSMQILGNAKLFPGNIKSYMHLTNSMLSDRSNFDDHIFYHI